MLPVWRMRIVHVQTYGRHFDVDARLEQVNAYFHPLCKCFCSFMIRICKNEVVHYMICTRLYVIFLYICYNVIDNNLGHIFS